MCNRLSMKMMCCVVESPGPSLSGGGGGVWHDETNSSLTVKMGQPFMLMIIICCLQGIFRNLKSWTIIDQAR